MNQATMIQGFRLLPDYFSPAAQAGLLDQILDCLRRSPPQHLVMPRSGKPMSVKMTNLGPLGWWSDVSGYRYVDRHPVTGDPWPAIPQVLLDLWSDQSGYPAPPQACLVNLYAPGARLGLHVDADEGARDAPVISVSLGDRAAFRLGGLARTDPTRSVRLASGDVCILGGESRNAFHGIDRILPGSSTLIPFGGRISLTLRRVTPPQSAETGPTS